MSEQTYDISIHNYVPLDLTLGNWWSAYRQSPWAIRNNLSVGFGSRDHIERQHVSANTIQSLVCYPENMDIVGKAKLKVGLEYCRVTNTFYSTANVSVDPGDGLVVINPNGNVVVSDDLPRTSDRHSRGHLGWGGNSSLHLGDEEYDPRKETPTYVVYLRKGDLLICHDNHYATKTIKRAAYFVADRLCVKSTDPYAFKKITPEQEAAIETLGKKTNFDYRRQVVDVSAIRVLSAMDCTLNADLYTDEESCRQSFHRKRVDKRYKVAKAENHYVPWNRKLFKIFQFGKSFAEMIFSAGGALTGHYANCVPGRHSMNDMGDKKIDDGKPVIINSLEEMKKFIGGAKDLAEKYAKEAEETEEGSANYKIFPFFTVEEMDAVLFFNPALDQDAYKGRHRPISERAIFSLGITSALFPSDRVNVSYSKGDGVYIRIKPRREQPAYDVLSEEEMRVNILRDMSCRIGTELDPEKDAAIIDRILEERIKQQKSLIEKVDQDVKDIDSEPHSFLIECQIGDRFQVDRRSMTIDEMCETGLAERFKMRERRRDVFDEDDCDEDVVDLRD